MGYAARNKKVLSCFLNQSSVLTKEV